MEEMDTTRTPDATDAEAPEQTEHSETGDQDGRDESSREYERHQALQNKIAAEQLKQLMQATGAQSIDELAERIAQPPAVRNAPAPRDDDPRAAIRQVTREVAIKEKDPVAIYALGLEEELEEIRRELVTLRKGTGEALTIRDIEDKAERDAILKHHLKNSHRIDLKGSIAEVREVRLAKRVEELEAKLAGRRGPDPETRTAPRMPSREAAPVNNTKKTTMTGDQADAKIEQLRAAGDHEGAKAFMRRIRTGQIVVED